MLRLFIFCIALSHASNNFAEEYSDDVFQKIKDMKHASLIFGSEKHTHIAIQPDLPLVPASTLKILTAFIALETWGADHRFITDFYLDKNDILWIKGYGDPFLISEEIDLIVAALKAKGLKEINGVGIDHNYFSSDLIIHGQSATNNPYDASPSALTANFNTINIRRKNKTTYSAEAQTPLTSTMLQAGSKLPSGTHRINLRKNRSGSRYFAEILVAKLNAENIQTTNKLLIGVSPMTLNPFYRHQNSHKLSEVVSAMLKYSNNFIANQLFLLLGVEAKGAPATIEKSQAAVASQIDQIFHWNNYTVKEGAGLSRANRLSTRQLIELLKKFSPYRNLLSQQNDKIFVKSGTLKEVSTYAGYVFRSQTWVPFALMINHPVKYNFRKKVAKKLLELK